jgi:hypothetical protein
MKKFQGSVSDKGAVSVHVVDADGAAQPLAVPLDHPYGAVGFGWGCAGPAQSLLALALCTVALGDAGRAQRVHPAFAAVSLLDIASGEGWEMSEGEIRELCEDLELGLPFPIPGEPQPKPREESQADRVRGALNATRAAMNARGFTEDEQVIGGLAAHFRAAHAMIMRGLSAGDPMLIMLAAQELPTVFARTLSLVTEDGSKYAMPSQRVVEVAKALEEIAMRETKKAFPGDSPRDGAGPDLRNFH